MSYDALFKLEACRPSVSGANDYTSKLLRGMAHRMNNVLTIYHGYSSLLLSLDDLSDTLKDGLGEIQTAAEITSDLLDRVLNAAREPIGNLTLGNIHEILQSAVKTVQQDYPEFKVVVEGAEGVEWFTDVALLRQALVPVLRNSAELEVSATGVLLKVDTRNEETLAVHVMDLGPGIAAADYPQIFDPFFTTKKAMGCLGLGLPLCRRLLEAMEGTVGVASEPGLGTRVELQLPRLSQA